jgi:hypothetical protein
MLEAHKQDLGMTLETFIEWVTDENALLGEYYKGLEVFVWFCDRWMETSRRA